MLTKSCPARVKAVAADGDDAQDGVFEAIVSVFGNVDSYGDMVVKGAFADTLKEWEESGNPIPVYWSHRMDDPDYNVGHVLEAKEIDEGLWVKAQLDLDPEAPGKARQVHRLMKGGRVTQFSFAYDIQEAGFAEDEEHGEFYELRKLKLFEVGPTPIGANQATELLAVKRASVEAERIVEAMKARDGDAKKNHEVLREAKEALEAAAARIEDVLTEDAPPVEEKSDEETATADVSANGDEPEGVKSEEPAGRSPADICLLVDLEYVEV